MNLAQCVCCSGKAFAQCCEPLLLQKTIAKTAVQLMRSRYSAFALGGFGEYLVKTWSTSEANGLSTAELSVPSVEWQCLEVVDHSQQGDTAFIEFKATFLDSTKRLTKHHESSRFKRVSGEWFYVSGDVSYQPQ